MSRLLVKRNVCLWFPYFKYMAAWPRQYSYGDKLLFLNAEPNSPQVVISKECLNTRAMGNTIELSDEFIVRRQQ